MSTGYVYDEVFLQHDMPGHPEGRSRLEAIMRRLADTDVLARLVHVPARAATSRELERGHRPAYIDTVRRVAEQGGGYLDPDTYAVADSYQAALTAAGATIEAAIRVSDRRLDNAFALVRPPGHHATAGHGMGFCLFGNLALAALALREERQVERILIADFDVHHGNGTQSMVEDDPNICFVSTHQFPHYPGTGAVTEVGRGGARGTLVNMPLSPGAGDQVFRTLYEQILSPVAFRFKPEFMLVSAGYDAHWDDPLAGLALSLSGYAWLSRYLVALAGELCHGRIVFVLEGGYRHEVLADGVLNTFYALLGEPPVVDPLGPSPRAEWDVSALVATLRQLHGLASR